MPVIKRVCVYVVHPFTQCGKKNDLPLLMYYSHALQMALGFKQ